MCKVEDISARCMMNRLSTAFAIGATGVFISLCSVAAQNWPTKPVRIIVPYAAGGSADTLARIVNDPLAEVFHQQFYVENRGGAGGLIGASAAAHAAPDGSTLVVSGIASHVIAPVINSYVDFDPIRDFTHIAYFGGPPIVLVAHPSLERAVRSRSSWRSPMMADDWAMYHPESVRWETWLQNIWRGKKTSSSTISRTRGPTRRSWI